jgi:hypothetical protein
MRPDNRIAATGCSQRTINLAMREVGADDFRDCPPEVKYAMTVSMKMTCSLAVHDSPFLGHRFGTPDPKPDES